MSNLQHKPGRSCYLLPPEELLEEVVRLRLSAPISLLTRVSRSVDILFLERREEKSKFWFVKLIISLLHLYSHRPLLEIKLHSEFIVLLRSWSNGWKTKKNEK